MSEPENLVLQLPRDIREEIGGLDRKMEKQGQEVRAEFRTELHSLRADVASDLLRRVEQRLDIVPPESH